MENNISLQNPEHVQYKINQVDWNSLHVFTQLAQQEEELKREEEAYFEAKREAARVAKLQRAKEKAAKKNATINGSRSWLGDDEEWEVWVVAAPTVYGRAHVVMQTAETLKLEI